MGNMKDDIVSENAALKRHIQHLETENAEFQRKIIQMRKEWAADNEAMRKVCLAQRESAEAFKLSAEAATAKLNSIKEMAQNWRKRLVPEASPAYGAGYEACLASDISRLQDVLDAEPKRPLLPRDILTTLFRGLVYGGHSSKREDVEKAWAWLEQFNGYEEMGQ